MSQQRDSERGKIKRGKKEEKGDRKRQDCVTDRNGEKKGVI
jgi:hypothetical protein